MRYAVCAIIVAFLLAPAVASASGRHPCGGLHFTVSAGAGSRVVERCAANMTANIAVDGHSLTTAELSHHGSLATFYGEGSVVRLVQRHGQVHVTAVTVRNRVRVRIWFTSY